MNYVFGQQHDRTLNFFKNHYINWCDVNMLESPHYYFLKDNVEFYKMYLLSSWPEKRHDYINEKILTYRSLLTDIHRNGLQHPIEFYTRYNGDKVIIHGNHRFSILKFLDLDIDKSLKEVSINDYILLILPKSLKFGLNNGTVPYQSIYYKDNLIIEGRRNDIIERHNLIKDYVEGKTVIDFGCNIGMSSFLALWSGANNVFGIDVYKSFVNSAIRMGVAFNCESSSFAVYDLSLPLKLPNTYDVGFCFSVDKHIKNNNQLSENISKHVNEKLFFETHEYSEIPKEIVSKFNNIEFIDTTFSGKRKLYVLEK